MSEVVAEDQHGHAEGHSHDWAEENRKFFDQEAHKYSSKPHIEEYTKAVVRAFQKRLAFKEDETTVLDYACGPGLVSQGLSQYVKKIVGVDISQKMVDIYNESVSNQGISAEEMQAFCVKLEGKNGELDGQKFDIVYCTAAYHHFEKLEEVTRTLAHFLKPAGALVVVDLVKPDDGQPNPFHKRPDVHHLVPHKGGFDEAEMKALFVDAAGLERYSYEPALEMKIDGESKLKAFIAIGYKPHSVEE